jgi:AcrR family transcriptional regulator
MTKEAAMSELTPRAEQILAAARELLEEEGPDALSMRRVAARLGIKAPSLYKHFASKEDLTAGLIAEAFEEWGVRFADAMRDTADPMASIAYAYRTYAREHPHLYRLMTERPLDRTPLVQRAEDQARAPAEAAAGGDPDLARAVWGFAHGMTILELNRRFSPGADIDAAWERGLAALRGTLSERRSGRATRGRRDEDGRWAR